MDLSKRKGLSKYFIYIWLLICNLFSKQLTNLKFILKIYFGSLEYIYIFFKYETMND